MECSGKKELLMLTFPPLNGWLVGWLVFPTRFQPLGYARITGVADSRRGADVNLHRPTSPSKEPSVPRGLRCPASIYDYVHLASRSDVFACVCVP